MPRIDSSYFGSIVIEGKKIDHDIIIDVNGNFQKKESSHDFTKRNLEDLLLTDPEVVVIGTGTAGLMKIGSDVELAAKMKGIEIVAKKTPDAILDYNKFSKRKRTVGVFHVTC